MEHKAIFDIFCTSATGERFIVDDAKGQDRFFKDRSLFHATFPIRERARKGDWSYRLMPIYFIEILDFEYDVAEERRKFMREVFPRDQDGDLFFDKLHFRFLQMPLFRKQEHELKDHSDKWIYFLKNLENFDHIPRILDEPIFQKAFDVAALANLDREQYTVYEQNLLDYWTTKAAFDTAREEGREAGRKEGEKRGEHRKALEIALALKGSGLEPARIAEVTGLPIHDIMNAAAATAFILCRKAA